MPPGRGRSDTRTVITIVVIVVAVVIIVPAAFAAILYFEVSGWSPGTGPGAIPIGSAFQAGSPSSGTCSSAVAAAKGCALPGDFVYTLTIEASSISFGDVEFEVLTASGAVFTNTAVGEFALVTSPGAASAFLQTSAGAGLAMTTTWTNYTSGFSPSTSLNVLFFSIVVDMGQPTPTTGLGLEFVAIGVGPYTGTIGISLP